MSRQTTFIKTASVIRLDGVVEAPLGYTACELTNRVS